MAIGMDMMCGHIRDAWDAAQEINGETMTDEDKAPSQFSGNRPDPTPTSGRYFWQPPDPALQASDLENQFLG